jgi:sec-independent protein translocase protein TatB
MLDMSWGEVMVIGAVALIVIGPKDLPKALRTVGNMTSKIRRMAAEFQGQFNEAMREAELDDVKKQLQGMNDSVSSIHKGALNPIQSIRDDLKGAIEAPSASPDKPATEIAGEAAAQARGEAHPVAPLEPPVVLPGSSVPPLVDPLESFTSTLNHEADVNRTEMLAEETRSAPGPSSSEPVAPDRPLPTAPAKPDSKAE